MCVGPIEKGEGEDGSGVGEVRGEEEGPARALECGLRGEDGRPSEVGEEDHI